MPCTSAAADWCRVSAFGPSCGGWRANSTCRAMCATTATACSSKSAASPPRWRYSASGWHRRRRRARASNASRSKAATGTGSHEGFVIADSAPGAGGQIRTAIGPDSAVCDDCLAELFNPRDRRYRYPFINCTQCGPRYTITRSLPYDRARTSMSAFVQCAEVRRRVSRSVAPALSRRTECLPRVRPAAVAGRLRRQ